MVKNYILRKKYPGSPEIGTELTFSVLVQKWVSDSLSLYSYDEEELSNYPEYWEEVEELCVPIGTKFTHYNKKKNTIYTIEKFIEDNKIIVSWNTPSYGSTKYDIEIANKHIRDGKWIKYKEPEKLFTTEDGIDIFDGDNVWWVAVNEEPGVQPGDKKYSYGKFEWPGVPTVNKQYKWFSTEKAAKNYIKCHKPVLSYSEVLKLYDGVSYSFQREEFKKELDKIIKEKL